MKLAPAHLRGVLANPVMVDREDVVRHPGDVWRVLSQQPLHFIHYLDRVATPVCLAINLRAAPATFIWTSPCGDEVHRALLMVGPPRIDIAMQIDCFTGGPGLRIKVSDLHARRVLMKCSLVVMICRAGDLRLPYIAGCVAAVAD